MDKTRIPQLGRARVRYLYENYLDGRKVHLDLTHGFSTFDRKEVNAELMEIILKWIKLMAPPKSPLKKVIADREQWITDSYRRCMKLTSSSGGDLSLESHVRLLRRTVTAGRWLAAVSRV